MAKWQEHCQSQLDLSHRNLFFLYYPFDFFSPFVQKFFNFRRIRMQSVTSLMLGFLLKIRNDCPRKAV
jgi:hypothetical protein